MKNIFSFVYILFLPLYADAQEYKIANWLSDKASATVLSFDDWSPGHGAIVVPDLIAKNLTATFFVNTKNASLGGGYAAMQNAVNHGLEIANHAASHVDLTILNALDLEAEVNGNKAILEAHLDNYKVLTFAYPFGKFNGAVSAKVMEKHLAARGVNAPVKTAFDSGTSWRYELNSRNNTIDNLGTVVVSSALSAANFGDWVKEGIHDGGILTFTFHSVYNGDVNDSWYNPIDEALLLKYLDTLKVYESRTWVTNLLAATQYHAEKKSAQLTTVHQNENLWTLVLTDDLPDSLYFQPLTVKLKMMLGKTAKSITQNNRSLLFSKKGDSLVFNALPDGGNISIALEDEVEIVQGPLIEKVLIFPNPTAGNFICSINSAKDLHATLKISDLQGKELFTIDMLNLQRGENLIPLDIAVFAKGMYLVNISGNLFSETYRVERE
jgi:peptidoglycan/xylan/chitin deacetylase (PgdA/CDA1 family)